MTSGIFSADFSLWTCAWQSTIFVGVGLLGSFLLRHRSSRAHQVLLLSMVAAVIVPLMSMLVKHHELGVFVAEPPVSESPGEHRHLMGDPQVTGKVGAAELERKPSRVERNLLSAVYGWQRFVFSWRSVLPYGWLMATLILTTRLVVTFALGVRLLNSAKSLECEKTKHAVSLAKVRLGIGRDVEVYTSEKIHSPVIWCWQRRPILLISGEAGGSSSSVDWTGVLSHELAHWKRCDHICGLLAELVVCVLPWHPLVWWAKSRLIALSEQACDDWVIACGCQAADYAESLIDLTPGGQMAFVPAVVSSKRGLAGRVRRILKDSCGNPRTGAAWALAACIVATCLTVGIAFAQTRPAKPKSTTERDEKSTTSLHQAAAAGDIEEVKKLVAEGAKLNARDAEGRAPLHLALELRRWKVAEYLISLVSDVNLTNNKGQTPLHLALIGRRRYLAEQLLAKGADVRASDKEGRTALHEAARRGQKAIVKRLITEGADVNAKDAEGSIPAMEAIRGGYLPLVNELIQMGADISCAHMAAYVGNLDVLRKGVENISRANIPWGFTLLHAAAAGGHRNIVEFLVEKGFDVKANTQGFIEDPGGTPLHYAACSSSKETIELLLDKGAELDADEGGPTPLAWAAWANQKGTAELLVSKGADVNKGEPPPLHWAIEWWETHMAEILLGLGADINVRDKKGNTPLHRATQDWFVEMGNLLISRGAYLNARNKEGQTPLHMAADDGFIEMARLLINNGADVNAKDMVDGTPLHFASGAGHKDVAELLIAKGAGINTKTREGRTALHEAATQGHRSVVELLIGKNADVNTKDNQGRTALQLAKENSHTEIVELLRKHGAKE